MTPQAIRSTPTRDALRLALVYAAVASTWIVFSDALLAWLLGGELFFAANAFKGIGFVLVTAGVLFGLIRREFRRRRTLSDRFQIYLDHTPDMVYRYRLDPEPRFEYVSPAATLLTGFTPEEHYADPFLGMKLVHPEDRPLLADLRTASDPAERSLELRWIRKDGAVLWVEQQNRIRRDDKGHRILEGSARNITKRREAEEERRRLQQAVQEVADAIVITDPEGIIVFANRAAAGLTGYTSGSLVGVDSADLRSGEDPATLYRQMALTLAQGRSWRGRLRNRRRNGERYTQETTITPMVNGAGQVISYVVVARDITVEEVLQERLEHAQRLELVGQMAAGTAHDFGNLLGVLRLNAEDAQGHLASDPAVSPTDVSAARDRVQEVLGAVQRGERLVTRLLSMGGSEELKVAPFDPGEFLDDLLPSLRAVLPRTVDIDAQVAPSTPFLLADRGAVEQIFLNLAANAGHAMPEGGKLTVRIDSGPREAMEANRPDPRPSRVHLSVTDTGIGIEADLLPRIWEPFFTTRSGKGGTGLGLPMVRLLVERLGGGVRIMSEPGRGTTVEVILPAANPEGARVGMEDLEPLPGEPLELAPTGGRRARLLVVDDDPALRRAISRALERMGHSVVTMDGAADALAWLEQADVPPEVIVTDVLMPGMNGVELFFRVQDMGIPCSFLFMSGAEPSDTPAQALLGGSVRFLEKPFAIQTLAETVDQVLVATMTAGTPRPDPLPGAPPDPVPSDDEVSGRGGAG